MQIIETDIPVVKIIEPKIFGDQRGFFTETFQVERYAAAGIGRSFLQDNLSRSSYGILRGSLSRAAGGGERPLPPVRGKVLDVAVDVRRGSPTFARHVSVELSDENR